MAIQTGNTVGFYFLPSTATTPLPVSGKTETMIYFDAKNKQICVGDDIIANVEGTNTFVTKDNAIVNVGVGIQSLQGTYTVGIGVFENLGEKLILFTNPNNPTQNSVLLTNLATPTTTYDAVNKGYVDSNIPIWIIS